MQPEPHLAQLDQYNFHHRISDEAGRTVVFFTAPGCSSCHALKRAFTSMNEDPDLSIFEIDAVMNPALTNELGFFHLPSMYLYIDGQYHAQIESPPLPGALRDAIETLSRLPAQEEP